MFRPGRPLLPLPVAACLACSAPAQEPAQAPPVSIASVEARALATPEAPPTTYAGVVTLLERANVEPAADRHKSYALVNQALSALTKQAGTPSILAKVKTASGEEALRLLPLGETVEVEPWQGGALRVAAARVVALPSGVVSLHTDRVTVWGSEPKSLEATDIDTLVAPAGETRFVLAAGASKAFVVDSQMASARFPGASVGAMLIRPTSGATRLGRQSDKGGGYEIVELPEGKQLEAWPELVAHDAKRGLIAVSRPSLGASKTGTELAIVRVSDGNVQAKTTVPLDQASSPLGSARISPDARSLASAAGSEALRIHFDSGRIEKLTRARKGHALESAAFTDNGAHVCVDAPGPAFPSAKALPSTTQRCYISNGVAHVAYLAPPPPGFRRAQREDFVAAGFGQDRTYEIISRDGSLVAAILYDGKPLALAKQRFTVAVYDAKTGKQLWNQFLDSMASLETPASLAFSVDGETLLVDGVRIAARTGVALDDKPVELASVAPLLGRFGIEAGDGALRLQRLGYPVPYFRRFQLVWAAELSPLPVSLFLDAETFTVALRSNRSKQTIVLASGPHSALALMPDGKFALAGSGDDLVCVFGSVLAPIEVCRGVDEIPVRRVARELAEFGR